MISTKEIFTLRGIGSSEVSNVAKKIKNCIEDDGFFSIWLDGNLGAGKTFLAGLILKELGLSESIAVTSPTFTYINTYKIGSKKIAHLDLYRNPTISFNTIVTDEFDGYLVEWPSNHLPNFFPTHKVSIKKDSSTSNQDSRDYIFSEISDSE